MQERMIAVLSVEQQLEELVFRHSISCPKARSRGSTHAQDETGHGHESQVKGNWFRASNSSGLLSGLLAHGVDRLMGPPKVGRV